MYVRVIVRQISDIVWDTVYWVGFKTETAIFGENGTETET